MNLPSIHINKILYATDLSENARLAFAYAVSLASKYNAQITILHTMTETSDLAVGYIGKDEWQRIKTKHLQDAKAILIGKLEESAAVKEALTQFVDRAKCEEGIADFEADEVLVEHGNPVEAILKVSREKGCDIIVMGSRGAGTFMDAMLGTTASRVLRRSSIPVLVIRLPDGEKKSAISQSALKTLPCL